ncbi:MAG: hypothetical protein DME03_23385 [Candidatus Rokuibacteriota bacterium]|nr:MAG: hypothetical protein DME03_23385 [Candidatus Rokubacteria bacterium]
MGPRMAWPRRPPTPPRYGERSAGTCSCTCPRDSGSTGRLACGRTGCTAASRSIPAMASTSTFRRAARAWGATPCSAPCRRRRTWAPRWSQVGSGLPNALVTDLRVDHAGTTAYASTYGRGMWSIPLPVAPPCAPPTNVHAQGGNGSATLTWQAPSRAVTQYIVTPYANGTPGTPIVFDSPATIEVVPGLTNGTTYTFTVTAANSAGPGPPSPQSNAVTPSASYPWSVLSTRQYSLLGSDGVTWTDIDPANLQLTITPSADSVALVSGNADLWTALPGLNQDIGVSMSGGAYPTIAGQPEAWKESGGFAGTFSPNAAYVQAVLHLKSGITYTLELQWKANKARSAFNHIWAGAGPIGPNFSPTRLTAVLLPESAQSVFDAHTTQQYTLGASDGVTWQPIDATNLTVSFTPSVASHAILTGNADLWTSVAGFNQDVGVAITGGAFPSFADQPEAWKESGGFAGTYSPNAAFVEGVIPLAAGVTYTANLVWKANRASPANAAIWAGAGPIGGLFSPTWLSVEMVPDSAGTLFSAGATQQYQLTGSNGITWTDVDGTNLVVNMTPASTCFAIVTANSDLWTASAGYNQDLGVDVSGGTALGPDQEGWKESGGFAGTFSPNAAFVQASFEMNGATAYTLSLVWKTNQAAAGSIFAGAGPIGGRYSPTSLVAQLFC